MRWESLISELCGGGQTLQLRTISSRRYIEVTCHTKRILCCREDSIKMLFLLLDFLFIFLCSIQLFFWRLSSEMLNSGDIYAIYSGWIILTQGMISEGINPCERGQSSKLYCARSDTWYLERGEYIITLHLAAPITPMGELHESSHTD